MSTEGVSARFRAVAWGGLALFAGTMVAVFALWRIDRSRHWMTPRLDISRFQTLEAPGFAPKSAREWWVLAVHPDCSHCRDQIRSFVALGERMTAPPNLAVLLVDVPRRPSAAAVSRDGIDAVWWDSRGIWRAEWGHRVYGEVLRFDPRGQWLESLSPEQVAARAPDR